MGISNNITFSPNFEALKCIRGHYSIDELEAEVGVYSATPEFVRKHCGLIANSILDKIPESYYEEAKKEGLCPNVDVRIHRLYTGDYPSYPGWHCDGQYRETYFSQPDIERTKVAKHIIVSVSSHAEGVSNTQFLHENFKLSIIESPDSDHNLWGLLDRELTNIQSKHLYDTKDGELILFDSWTPHRTMPARIRGWRLFFRMAMWYRPNLGEGGKISKQEQVYKLHEGSGW